MIEEIWVPDALLAQAAPASKLWHEMRCCCCVANGAQETGKQSLAGALALGPSRAGHTGGKRPEEFPSLSADCGRAEPTLAVSSLTRIRQVLDSTSLTLGLQTTSTTLPHPTFSLQPHP